MATNRLGEVKVVTLSETNTRNLRMRPDENEKAAAIITAAKSAQKKDFAQKMGAYGKLWVDKYLDGRDMPTV